VLLSEKVRRRHAAKATADDGDLLALRLCWHLEARAD
jgi:hypothetical protein